MVAQPITLTDLPGNQYQFSLTGNDWDIQIPFTEQGNQLQFEENGYNGEGEYESSAGRIMKFTDETIGFIGGVGHFSNHTKQDILYSNGLVGVATRQPYEPNMLAWEGQYNLDIHTLMVEPGNGAYFEPDNQVQAELNHLGGGNYRGQIINDPDDDGGDFTIDGIALRQLDSGADQDGSYYDQHEWLVRGPDDTFFNIGSQYRYNDAQMMDLQDNDYWLSTVEPLTPSVSQPGVIGVRAARDIDYGAPGTFDDAYGCVVEIIGHDITHWTVATPWGDTYDSTTHHGPVWDGSDFYQYNSYMELETETDNDGSQYIQVDWEDVAFNQWNLLQSQPVTVTVDYTGGSWTKAIDLSRVTVPNIAPTLTNPTHNQTNVPTNTDIQWQRWNSSQPNDIITVNISEDQNDDNEYFAVLSGNSYELPLYGSFLTANTQYEIETAFTDITELPVGSDGVTIWAIGQTESDNIFNTGDNQQPPLQQLPDLVPHIDNIKSYDVIVPGDKLRVSVLVDNQGIAEVKDKMNIRFYASADQTVDGSDVLLASLENQNARIKVNAQKKYNANVVIPYDIAPGDYYMLVEVDAGSHIPELNETNNVAVSDGTGTIACRSGTFADRRNVKLKATDDQGKDFCLALSGDGYAELSWNNGKPEITLFETTEKSSLTIKSKSQIDLGRILCDPTGPASLGKLTGKLVNLADNINLTGSLGTLQINNINDQVEVQTHIGYSKGTTIKANNIADAVFDITGDVKSMQANVFLDGLLKGNNIFKVDIKNGDLGANLSALDIIKRVKVNKGDILGNFRAGTSMDQIQGQDIEGAILSTPGDINKIKANNILDTIILAGYDIGPDCQINTGDEYFSPFTANINSIQTHAKGSFEGSFALAGVRPVNEDFSQIISADKSLQQTSSGSIKNAKFGQVHIGDESVGVYGIYAATEIGRVKFTEIAGSGLPDFQAIDTWF